jgi:hypothetical protein
VLWPAQTGFDVRRGRKHPHFDLGINHSDGGALTPPVGSEIGTDFFSELSRGHVRSAASLEIKHHQSTLKFMDEGSQEIRRLTSTRRVAARVDIRLKVNSAGADCLRAT